MVRRRPGSRGVTAACGQITRSQTQLPHGGRGWPGGRGYGHFAALEAIKLLSGIETPAGELRRSTVSLASGAAWRCAAPVVAGMRRKQCRSCLTINRCSAPPANCSRTTGATRPTTSGRGSAINQQIVPRDQWAQHIVQDGTRSCFFRLLQGVEMLRIADKRLIHICLPAPGNSLLHN